MNTQLKPGRIVPQDHVEYLIARYGWWRILRACLTLGLRRGRHGLRPARLRRKPGTPPDSDYLRRDIGLPPERPSPRYWDLR